MPASAGLARADAAKGRLDDPELDAAAYDAGELATRLARGEARLFRLGLYLTVHAWSEQELSELVAGAPYPRFQRVFSNAEFLGGLPRRVTYHVTQEEGDAQTG